MTELIGDEADIEREMTALLALDPALEPVARTAGRVPLRRGTGGLKGLYSVIIAQQVSKASADAIFGRLEATTDLDDAEAVLALQDEAFRTAGVSRPKQRTLLGLAEAVRRSELDLERVGTATAENAIAELVRLKGVGVWTAECFLLFHVGHRDVFPAGDLALRAAYAIAFGHEERPAPKLLAERARAWSPHRSVAARLFWAYYAAVTRRDAAPAGS